MIRKASLLLSVLFSVFFVFTLAGAEEDGIRIKNKVSNSVVRIFADNYSYGTGFFVNDRYIVTNHHVVSVGGDGTVGGQDWEKTSLNNEVTVVYSYAGNDMISGKVVQDWPEVDLAVVEIDPNYSKRVPLKLMRENDVIEGMKEFAIGFPGVNQNDFLSNDNPTITDGILSKKYRTSILSDSQPYYEISYSSFINQGNSGGPIVNLNGDVLGIANSTAAEGVAYYGIFISELTNRLTTAGIPFSWAENTVPDEINSVTVEPTPVPVIESKPWFSEYGMWIIIGVLGLAIIVMLIVLLTGKKTDRGTGGTGGTVSGGSGGSVGGSTGNASVQGMSGKFQGMKKSLSKEKDCVFGKDPDCTFRFEDKTVSGKHCRIHYSKSNQRFIIQDLGSTNGTIIVRGQQRQKVSKDSGIALHDGDLIYIVGKENSFKINL